MLLSPRTFLVGAGASRHAGYPLMSELYDRMAAGLEALREWESQPDTMKQPERLYFASEFMKLWRSAGYPEIRENILFNLAHLDHLGASPPKEDFVNDISPYLKLLARAVKTSPSIIRNLEFFWTFLACMWRIDHYNLSEIGFKPFPLPPTVSGKEACWGARILLEKAIAGEGDSPWIEELCRSLRPGETVITTNYDLLIDRALTKTGLWNPLDGYGDEGKAAKYGGSMPASRFQLLKLHGSVNWVTELSYAVFGPLNPDRYWILFDQADSGCTVEDKDWWYLENQYCQPLPSHSGFEPLVIEPIFKRIGGRNPFDRLWEKAFQIIRKTRTLVAIGYSFPEADEDISALIDEGVRQGSLARMLIVDPDVSVKDRAEKKWGSNLRLDFAGCKAEEWSAYGSLLK